VIQEKISQNAARIIHKEPYQKIYIIGDTQRDISAARSIGFPVISVASGNYSSSDLSKYDPDFLVQNLKVDSRLLIDYLSK